MASYAVVETGGKQYRVEKGTTLLVDRLPQEEGEEVALRPVAYRDKEMVVGKDLEKVKVEAKVTGHERGPKIRVFKYRAKKGYRRRAGHRSELTRLEVTDLRMLQRKPASTASRSASGGASKSSGAPRSGKGGTRKAPARKPAAKEKSDGS